MKAVAALHLCVVPFEPKHIIELSMLRLVHASSRHVSDLRLKMYAGPCSRMLVQECMLEVHTTLLLKRQLLSTVALQMNLDVDTMRTCTRTINTACWRHTLLRGRLSTVPQEDRSQGE